MGSAVANEQGAFQLGVPATTDGRHDFWLIAIAPWPDQVSGQPTLLSVINGMRRQFDKPPLTLAPGP